MTRGLLFHNWFQFVLKLGVRDDIIICGKINHFYIVLIKKKVDFKLIDSIFQLLIVWWHLNSLSFLCDCEIIISNFLFSLKRYITNWISWHR